MPVTANSDDRRSPIKEPLLRLPGQKLRDDLDELMADRGMRWVLVLVLPAGLAFMEWLRLLMRMQTSLYSCVSMTILAIPLAVIGTIKLRRVIREGRNIWLGMEGEIAVGQFLENYCRNTGHRVLHDLPGKDFNVDHILIGPGGIYVIETKTRTKPSANSRIRYDGKTVLVDGHPPDRDPIAQVKACADHVRNLLARSTGYDPRDLPIRPVVLFPGWWIDGKSGGREVWVLNCKAFRTFLENEAEWLTSQDIALFYSRLAGEAPAPER